MKQYIKVLGATIMGVLSTACTGHFQELDDPKTTSTVIDPGPIFTRSLVAGSGISVGIWQNTNQLTTLDWTQYVTSIKSGFTQSQYEPVPQTSIWSWWYSREAFAGMHLGDHAVRLSMLVNNPLHEAMSRIWKAYMFQYMTDMYGDIPYFEAFRVVQPKYDTQEAIYADLIAEVQKGVKMLKDNQDAGFISFGSADVLYKGDTQKWIKFGNSLLLRMAMQCSNVADESITKPILSAIDFSNPLEFISENDDNAKIMPDPAGPTFHVKNPYAFVGSWEEVRISKTFYDRLNKNQDPRIAIYMAPNVKGEFVGLPSGQRVADLNSGYTNNFVPNYCDMGSYFMQDNTPFVLMSASEIYFLLAEASQKGYVSGSSTDYYGSAVRASLDQYQISAELQSEFLAKVPYNEQNLYEQFWISLFPNGPQGWNLIRRTGKPAIAPLVENWPSNLEMPRRFSYSTDEIRYNTKNVQAAIDRIGGDTHYNRVWWDKK